MAASNKKNKIIITVIAVLVIVAVAIIILILKGNTDKDSNASNATADGGNVGVETTDSKTNLTENPVPTEIDSVDTASVAGLSTKDDQQDNESKEDVASSSSDSMENISTDSSTEVKVLLGTYKGIKAGYAPVEVTDEMIDDKVERFIKNNSYYVDLPDREFRKDDMAIVSIHTFVDGSSVDDISVYCLQVIIGSGLLPEYIENAIVGKKKGEFFDVYWNCPADDTSNPKLAGKQVQYNVELVDGFELYVPELTDQFIKDKTGYESIEAYRNKIKSDLQEEENQKAHDKMMSTIKGELIASSTFSGNIEEEIKVAYVQKMQENNDWADEYYGMDGATYYALAYDMTLEEYQKMLMEEAELEVKYRYLLDEIALQEGIAASNPDLNKQGLRELAEELVIASCISAETSD